MATDRVDGRGGAAYDPAVMVALLVYAYCVGERSSRRVERRCVEDVAYRVVARNLRPDHATIARFRAGHAEALAQLFVQVLALCAEAGMVRVGVVALDGTKLAASASLAANMSEPRLEAAIAEQVAKMLAEAAAVDAAEDELFGDARGDDELPPELAARDSRLRRLAEARDRLKARARAAADTGPDGRADADPVESGPVDTGPADTGPDGRADADPVEPETGPTGSGPGGSRKGGSGTGVARVNVTDPQSRVMKTQRGWVQGYNAQAAATVEQVVVAARVCDQTGDCEQFAPMVAATAANLAGIGIAEPVNTWLADAGYYSSVNATLEMPGEALIATAKAHKLATEPPPAAACDPSNELETQRIELLDDTFGRVNSGELTIADAVERTGLSMSQTYKLHAKWVEHGRHGLERTRRVGNRRRAKWPRSKQIKHALQTRLADPEARALYKQRGQIIEPVFGQIKDPRGIRSFQRRGLAAVDAEWKLICATHNLLKLWRA